MKKDREIPEFTLYCSCGKKYTTRIVTSDMLCPDCTRKKAKALAKLHGMRF